MIQVGSEVNVTACNRTIFECSNFLHEKNTKNSTLSKNFILLSQESEIQILYCLRKKFQFAIEAFSSLFSAVRFECLYHDRVFLVQKATKYLTILAAPEGRREF